MQKHRWSSGTIGLLMGFLLSFCIISGNAATKPGYTSGEMLLDLLINIAIYGLLFSLLISGFRKLFKL